VIAIGASVEIAGVRFEPGDLVVGDAETRMRAAIEEGMQTSDAFKQSGIL
jgi:regulator of RNase E activity RraA